MMKKICFPITVLIFLMWTPTNWCLGQGTTNDYTHPLTIGDTVPDIIFDRLINSDSAMFKLSDFKGKAILLDFWATWCVPCIAAFPKLEQLQKEFSDGLKVILLSKEEKVHLEGFYAKKNDLLLPTFLYHPDDKVDSLFPHHVIPHYIWIDKNQRVYAITNGEEITEAKIRNFVSGTPQHLTMKNDSRNQKVPIGEIVDSIQKIGGLIQTISIQPTILYESRISRYDPRLTHSTSLGRGIGYQHRFLEMQNVSVVHMLQWASGYTSSKDNWRFFLDLNDTTLTYPSRDYATWEREHSFSYRLILGEPDSALRFQILKRDLELVFGLNMFKKKIDVPALVLRRIGNNLSIMTHERDTSYNRGSIYGIDIVNKPISSFIQILNRYHVGEYLKLKGQLRLPIVDESNIEGNIDLKIDNVNIKDIQELNGALRAKGLILVATESEIEMIVITDKYKHPS